MESHRVRSNTAYSLILVMLLVFSLTCMPFAAAVSEANPVSPEALKAEKEVLHQNDLLQFRAGGHIIGFKNDKVLLVGMGYALIEEFVGASGATPVAEGKALENNNSTGGASPFNRVSYSNLWEGINVNYAAKEGGLAESTYIIQPGAGPEKIRLRYNTKTEIQNDGTLLLKHPSNKGYFTQTAPIAWQEINGKRIKIDVAFQERGDNTVGFVLGRYDGSYPVVIDPTYEWHTFYGGPGGETGYSIAVDGDGNIYVTGSSSATWQGDGNANPLHPYSSATDMIVLKLNSSGAYQWHTFYGGTGSDYGYGLAVDGSGNIYVAGYSAATWQGDLNTSPLHPYTASYEIFALKLNSSGAYQWHTFYGGTGLDYGYGIAVNGTDLYLTGSSAATWQGDGNTSPLHPYTAGSDITVLKLNSSGAYQWHTFYGSSVSDTGKGAVVDGSGNVYVAGYSSGTWQGAGNANPLHAYTALSDIMVLKLNSSGAYQWHTFYGGAGNDYGRGVDVDGSGNIYVAGYSYGTWQGDSDTGPVHAYGGGTTGIAVLKLNGSGAYQWHTFYGSNTLDSRGHGIAVNGSSVLVTGYSSVDWLGDGDASPLHAFTGGQANNDNITILALDSAGTYSWHTFYGGLTNTGYGIASKGNGTYVTGNSGQLWQGDDFESGLHAYVANDLFVLKLSDVFFEITTTAGENGSIVCDPNPVIANADSTCTITPEPGYRIDTVTVDDELQDPAPSEYIFTDVTAAHTISATFAPEPLDGSCGASNGGTFTSAPSEDLCLTGTPSEVSGSGPWTWSCLGLSGGSDETDCSANIQTYEVTFQTDGNGTLTGTTPQTVNHGGSASEVTANAHADYHFGNWTGTGGFVTTTSNPLTVSNVTANMTITANFAHNAVNGACGASNGGTFTSAPSTDLCLAGDPSAVSGSGPWTWSCLGQFSGSDATDCSANIRTYTISAGAAPHGVITPSGDTAVNVGAGQTYTMTPGTGYYIDDVLVDGVSVGAAESYEFTGVAAGHTIEARFGRELEVVAIGDANGNASEDIAALKVDLTTGANKVYVRDGATGNLIRTVSFIAGYRAIDMKALPDVSGNGVSEIALLCQDRTTGNVLVQIKDALTGAWVNSIDFGNKVPWEMTVISDMNGNGYPEVGVLKQDVATGALSVQIKDAMTDALLRTLTFSKNYDPVRLMAVDDVNGNGVSEIGLAAMDSVVGNALAKLNDASTGSNTVNLTFGPGVFAYDAVSLPDLNGNSSPEIGLLLEDTSTDAVTLKIKDAVTKALIRSITYNKDYAPLRAVVISDLDGNGYPEVGVLAVHRTTGAVTVQIKDAYTGGIIKTLSYSKSYEPVSVLEIQDVNGNGSVEIGVAGMDYSTGAAQLSIVDSSTKAVLRNIPIP